MSCQDMEVGQELGRNDRRSECGEPFEWVARTPQGSTACVTKNAAKSVPSVHVFAAIVVEDGGKPHTINLCRNCNDCRMTDGFLPLNVGAISNREEVGKASVGSSNGWKQQRKAAQQETFSSWQNESPHKEELELLRVSGDLRLEGSFMRQAS